MPSNDQDTAPTPLRVCAVAVVVALAACQGAVDGSNPGGGAVGGNGSGASGNGAGTSGSSSGGNGSDGLTGDPAALCAQAAGTLRIGRTRLRRLTRAEFDHTVRDLLGASGNPAGALAPDESIGPFYSNAIAPITDLLVQQHGEVAAALAADAATRMAGIAPCDLAADTGTACATRFIEEFGLKAYRRPLEAVEREKYLNLYSRERARGSAQSAFTLVVQTLLESPFFLYHVDAGATQTPSDAPVPLTSYELASRLSYFLWATMPDAELFSLAANDTLKDEAVLSAEVDRMLADARALDAIPAFHLQWLGVREMDGVEKDPARFPSFNPALVAAMREETATFADFVIRRGDGLMRTLFTANFSFLTAPLLPLYGVAQPAGFQPGAQVALDPAQRSGILTHASVLARHAHRDQTSPVHRGILVRENLLCQPLQPPPPTVNTSPPAVSDVTSTRQRFAAHVADPACAGCHTLIDPIGLGFEAYDALGAYRTTDGSAPVDATGEVKGATGALAGPFDGAIELGQKLAASREAQNCLANQWFRFALGRMEAVDDACSVQAIHEGFAASDGNIRTLLTQIAKSPAFRNVKTGLGQ